MKPDQFQARALATWYSADEVPTSAVDIRLIAAAMGLGGEAGEFLDSVKKMAFKPGREYDRRKLIDELGDVFFYLCVLSWQLGISVEDLSARNREKLKGGKHGWSERLNDEND